jgi:3-deoxy-D-arabino-heptulosonate 7-phosphate (DAHP) synthase
MRCVIIAQTIAKLNGENSCRISNWSVAARQGKRTKIKVGSVIIGEGFVVVGGPCGVESEEQTISTAEAVKAGGG